MNVPSLFKRKYLGLQVLMYSPDIVKRIKKRNAELLETKWKHFLTYKGIFAHQKTLGEEFTFYIL